jgi:hypothetical protein
MNPSHAAALALVGWYLMVPPFDANQTPLGKWHIVKVLDSAKQCQSERDSLVFTAEQELKSNRGLAYDTKSKGTEYFDATAAQCIATHDPRLNEK